MATDQTEELDQAVIRASVDEMLSGVGGRPAVPCSEHEIQRLCNLTRELRAGQSTLVAEHDAGQIDAGTFYDRQAEHSDRIMGEMMVLLGRKRYIDVFDSDETRIRYCTRDQFIAMAERKRMHS